MLASLLRAILLSQVLLGAAMAYWLYQRGVLPAWGMVGALALPFATLVLVDIVSAIRSRPGEGARLWWRALRGEWVAGIRVFVLRQPWTFQPPKVQKPQGAATRIPVLLVHGYTCNHRIWDGMAQALRRRGHTVYAVNLEPLFTSIDHYAQPLETAMAELLEATGAPHIALVGHSMGGLAIRALMRQRGHAQIARVLTLGSPHQGTLLAKGAATANGRQMVWQSRWLQDLAASETPQMRAVPDGHCAPGQYRLSPACPGARRRHPRVF